MSNKTKNVALVLSSGGARGMAHIGVIEGLLESGYHIKSIAGSSMGAVVGGVYAAGKLEEYKNWLIQLDKLEVFRLIDFTFSAQGFIRGEKVFNEMQKFIGDIKIEELNIPFCAVACDIRNRKEVVFSKGSLFAALRASAAIPSVIKPSIHNNIELVDGGVMNPIPTEYVVRTKEDIIVVSDVNANVSFSTPVLKTKKEKAQQKGLFNQFMKKWEELVPKEEKNKTEKLSYFDLLNRSINLMQDQISSCTLEKYPPDILVSTSREACGVFDFHKAEELIASGKLAFQQAITNKK